MSTEMPDWQKALLHDINQLPQWIDPQNLAEKAKLYSAEREGINVIGSIDGVVDGIRDVAFVTLTGGKAYRPHIHKDSDAHVIILSGEGNFLGRKSRVMFPIKAGMEISIPRMMWHGFEVEEGESLTFVSLQSPPIIDKQTGDWDLHTSDE